MKKICIIGDSHVGAMKLGWDEISSEYPDVEIVFFAAARSGMRQLTNDGSVLSIKKDLPREKVEQLGEYGSIDIEDFDAILCVGMGLLIHPFVKHQREHLLPGQSTSSRTQHYVSEDAYLESWIEIFEKSPLQHVLNVLGNAKASSVFVSFKPLVSTDVSKKKDKVAKAYIELGENKKDRDRLWSILHRGIETVLPASATFFPQPEETVLNELLTKSKYSVRSTRLMAPDEEHGIDDHKHMNASYGVAYIRNFLEQFAE